MIHELDETIRQVLITRGKLNGHEIDIEFDQPTGEWAATLSRPTINCWLYDIRENAELRANLQFRTVHENGRARRVAPPLRFDLSYLVTSWTRKAEDEHRLLWRALGALASIRVLEPAACVGALQNQPFKIPIKVAQGTTAVSTLAELWGVLDNQMRAGFNFVATLAFDPEFGFESELVLAKQLVVGQSETPERQEITSSVDTIWQVTEEFKQKKKEGQS
ncbi:MAG: DUF4255 domain-containing protein [Anaerolineae bacterium]|nr:DUF4255 domain-containing protein [Anaerolineae bacterium]